MRARVQATSAKRKHSSVAGGSTCKLRILCPKSIDEERNAHAVNEDTVWSKEGTALHTIFEEVVRADMSKHEMYDTFTGREIEQTYISRDLLREKTWPAVRFFDSVEKHSYLLETEVNFGSFIPNAYGTADVLFDGPDTGIIDNKFGDGINVEATDNDQLRFYLSAAIRAGKLPVRDKYRAIIFQPARSQPPSLWAKEAWYSAEHLDDFAYKLKDAIELWRSGKSVHKPGAHCASCKGKIACPAYREMLTTGTSCDIEGLSLAELADWKRKIPSIKSFIEEINSAAFRNAAKGKHLPGWELQPLTGDREFTDEDKALRALTRLGVPAERRTTSKAISAPQALLALKEIGTPEDQIAAFEKKYIRRPNNGEKLVACEVKESSGSALGRLATALKARGS